jgi:putative hydrolase of the HAD superfamily
MRPIRAVLLDFYCTLVDLSDSVRSSGFDQFARRLGLPLAPGELYRRYVELISQDEPDGEGIASFIPYRQSWVSAGRRLLAPFGREQAGALFADAYADLHATAAMFPDVPDALRALGRDFRLGVVANADHDYLTRCLDRHGLRFQAVVDSQTARCYKPEPRIFHHACTALAVPPAEAAMVGDTPDADVEGARRAGLGAIWLNRDHRAWPAHLDQPDATIDNLGQLLALCSAP